MKKNIIRTCSIFIFLLFAVSIGFIFASNDNIKLSASYNDDTANLIWENIDSTSQYTYRVLKSENDGDYNGLSAEGSRKVKVLNIYPNVTSVIYFLFTDDKSAPRPLAIINSISSFPPLAKVAIT